VKTYHDNDTMQNMPYRKPGALETSTTKITVNTKTLLRITTVTIPTFLIASLVGVGFLEGSKVAVDLLMNIILYTSLTILGLLMLFLFYKMWEWAFAPGSIVSRQVVSEIKQNKDL
jgi:hypothetical protein